MDHKRIGILYLVTAFGFFVIGGIEALLIRLQLAVPTTPSCPDIYNMLFTMHGTTMIFLVAMPALFGLANYFVPLHIGARDMAFPRLNALSFWLLPFGGLLLHFSFLAGGAPAAGWFSYAPLSETPYSSQPGVDYWALALAGPRHRFGGTSINLIVTVLTLRAPGMTLRRLPLFSWMIFVNSFLVILAMPVLNAAIVMLLIDRLLERAFFPAARRRLGDACGSTIFWTFGHPEVYIVAISGVRHHLGSHSGFFPQADLRLRVCRRLNRGDRALELRRLGASHVHGRAGHQWILFFAARAC